jgi:acyl phosphate:glycerol-3-phosphate acyltransferase
MLLFPLTLVLAYVAGSINFSILLFRLLGREDPRVRFSGNPGVSNVFRLAGPGWAAAVLSLDLVRAMGVALLAAAWCSPTQIPWCALSLVAGNMLPVFHGFRGGKGVANTLGFTVVAVPWAALLGAWVWLLIFGIVRVPFLGSFGMVAVLCAGLALAAGSVPSAVAAVLLLGAILLAHRTNIAAIRTGTPRGS